MEPGKITRLPGGVEQLELTLRVEKFDNGAHVYLVVTQRSDCPDEIELTSTRKPDSKTPEYVMLSATMGNKARARLLWLADGPRSTRQLYPDFSGDGFAGTTVFELRQLHRTADGDALVAITTDEANPAKAKVADMDGWYYGGQKVTQYWRKSKGDLRRRFAGGGQRPLLSTGGRNCRFPAARPSRTSRFANRSATASGCDSA